MSRTALVIVASTRAAEGTYEDRSGPVAVEFLRGKGFRTPDPLVVPDAEIEAVIAARFADPATLPNVVLTSGGTGLSPDDRTVEAVQPFVERELPGIVHAFWEEGRKSIPTAVVSRAVAGVVGRTFVMTLPGSVGGVQDGCTVLEQIIVPVIDMLEGVHEH